jgi:hypothetical protein
MVSLAPLTAVQIYGRRALEISETVQVQKNYQQVLEDACIDLRLVRERFIGFAT